MMHVLLLIEVDGARHLQGAMRDHDRRAHATPLIDQRLNRVFGLDIELAGRLTDRSKWSE